MAVLAFTGRCQWLFRLRGEIKWLVPDADELAGLSIEAVGEDLITWAELVHVKEQQRQLRVLLADCERQLRGEG